VNKAGHYHHRRKGGHLLGLSRSTIPEKLTPGGFKMTINSMVILPKDYIDRKLIELKKAGKSIHISSNHRKSDRQLVCSSCDL
jgi:hypothetical protein